MSLLGEAAMVLWYDIAPDAIAEHDDWHTHEHLPERVSIPGFVRALRWVAQSGNPRYFVMYEVRDIGILSSPPYLERLNNPTPWTAKMMPSFRGMTRGFCDIRSSFGFGVGEMLFCVRLEPAPGKQVMLHDWLTESALPAVSMKPGLASAYLLESTVTPPMTAEQQIRGPDARVTWVLLVTGYSSDSVLSVSRNELRQGVFEEHGASRNLNAGVYRLQFLLTNKEVPPALSAAS